MEEDPLTLSDHTCPKHTDGGALGVAHIEESLLSSFLYNKINRGWKIIFSHLIHTAKEENNKIGKTDLIVRPAISKHIHCRHSLFLNIKTRVNI